MSLYVRQNLSVGLHVPPLPTQGLDPLRDGTFVVADARFLKTGVAGAKSTGLRQPIAYYVANFLQHYRQL